MYEKELLDALAAPFEPQNIEWRVQSATRGSNGEIRLLVLPYIESRAVMSRLDAVCGCRWQTRYRLIEINGKQAFQCQLSIKIGDEWITRTDGADVTEIESVKGGHSNALKRAAVQWGIGRYLYDLPSYWVVLKQHGEHRVYGQFNIGGRKEQIAGYFDAPSLPQWALPKGFKATRTQKEQFQNGNQQSSSKEQVKREQALHFVNQLLNFLAVPSDIVPVLMKRATGKKYPLEQASYDELQKLYMVLSPVCNYVDGCRKMGLSLEELLYYARIVLKVDLKNILSLLFKMDDKMAQQCLNLAREDKKQLVG